MTILSSTTNTTNQLPPLKLPSLFQRGSSSSCEDDEWTISTSNTLFKEEQQDNTSLLFNHSDYYHKISTTTTTTTDILLPPILTTLPSINVASSPVPLSPPYSTCSSAFSVSSFPSSPNSSSGNSFSSLSTTTTKKGSIQSLLNSGSELLALEKNDEELLVNYFNNNNKKRPVVVTAEVTSTKKKQRIIQVEHHHQDNRQIKGLRLFSKQVCDKVAKKKTTTYNEVADELAADIQRNNFNNNGGIDQKNIRRRVYDALNVLMALDIISKDRKEIKWLGIHNNSQQEMLEQEIKIEESRQKILLDSIETKRASCNDTFNNLNRLKQLVKRNQYHHRQQQHSVIQLPFFLLEGKEINTEFNHGHEACLSSSNAFAIYQDIDILSKIWPQPPQSSTVTTVS